jgi:hypothetical protein
MNRKKKKPMTDRSSVGRRRPKQEMYEKGKKGRNTPREGRKKFSSNSSKLINRYSVQYTPF